MKKLFYLLIVALVMPLLGGCFGKGSSADPPANFLATAGDGRVMLTWTPVPDVDYWIFTATDPTLTAFNWTGLANAHVYIHASTPFYVCGLYSGTLSNGTVSPLPYYFAANGRTNGGPGGTSSPTITATPYNASAVSWNSGSTSPAPNLLGAGYTSLTTCSNNATSAAGTFAAVGAGGAIFTGTYAIGPPYSVTWTQQASPVTTDLNAVTGYAANQNNPTSPSLRWIAVGAGGISVYSTDVLPWTAGGSTGTTQALRSITHSAGTFIAVGDAGTILSTADGITWTSHSSGLTSNPLPNLNGVTHGTYYAAVGGSGTILTSADGNTWTSHTATPDVSGINLRQVAYYGSIIVAVGGTGTIVTSKDNGATWTSQTLTGTPNLVGIATESQYIANAVADPQLGYISTVQFVAIDSGGNTYTSQNGIDWSPANSTGIAANALVGSGFGYIAVGNSGATAYAF